MSDENQKQDILFPAKRVVEREDSKGRDMLIVSFSKEDAEALLEVLAEEINERGVKLQIHVGTQTTHDGSREFRSAFMFCKGVPEPPASSGRSSGAPSRTKAKAEKSVRDRVRGLRERGEK